MHSAEVVVVGAGPAGCAAALLLSRCGHDVLLVDQCRFPRDKPCGEYLNPAAVAVLRRLGLLEPLLAAGARRVTGVLLGSPVGCVIRVPYPEPGGAAPFGLSVPRLALDHVLLEAARAAGARVREGVRVDDVVTSGTRVTGLVTRGEDGRKTIRARLILAADGTRSIVARRLRVTREPAVPRRFGLVAHYEDVAGDDWVEMHAGARGYCGLGYSAGGSANVAMVAEPADLPRIRGRTDEFFEERLGQFPAIQRRLASGRRCGRVMVTASLSARVAHVAASGVLLVGDAAGFYDPFTGEGLSYALRGAELAADAAAAALAADVAIPDLNHRGTEDTEEDVLEEKIRAARRAPQQARRNHPREDLVRLPSSWGTLCPLFLCGSIQSAPAEAAAFREYAARRRAEFGPRVLVSRVIQAVLARPWALEVVFRRFEAEPGLAQRLIGVTAGILPPRVVMNPAFLTQLLSISGVRVCRRSGVQDELLEHSDT